jgi:hypothetical protein
MNPDVGAARFVAAVDVKNRKVITGLEDRRSESYYPVGGGTGSRR